MNRPDVCGAELSRGAKRELLPMMRACAQSDEGWEVLADAMLEHGWQPSNKVGVLDRKELLDQVRMVVRMAIPDREPLPLDPNEPVFDVHEPVWSEHDVHQAKLAMAERWGMQW